MPLNCSGKYRRYNLHLAKAQKKVQQPREPDTKGDMKQHWPIVFYPLQTAELSFWIKRQKMEHTKRKTQKHLKLPEKKIEILILTNFK